MVAIETLTSNTLVILMLCDVVASVRMYCSIIRWHQIWLNCRLICALVSEAVNPLTRRKILQLAFIISRVRGISLLMRMPYDGRLRAQCITQELSVVKVKSTLGDRQPLLLDIYPNGVKCHENPLLWAFRSIILSHLVCHSWLEWISSEGSKVIKTNQISTNRRSGDRQPTRLTFSVWWNLKQVDWRYYGSSFSCALTNFRKFR